MWCRRIWHAIWHGRRKTGCDRRDSGRQTRTALHRFLPSLLYSAGTVGTGWDSGTLLRIRRLGVRIPASALKVLVTGLRRLVRSQPRRILTQLGTGPTASDRDQKPVSPLVAPVSLSGWPSPFSIRPRRVRVQHVANGASASRVGLAQRGRCPPHLTGTRRTQAPAELHGPGDRSAVVRTLCGQGRRPVNVARR